MCRLVSCLLLLSLAVPMTARAADTDTLVFERLRRLAGLVQTIRSDFVQEKHLSIFKHVMVSSGRFMHRRPDGLRWEYLEPSRRGFALSGGSGRQWDDLSQVDKPLELSSSPLMSVVAGQLLSWAAFDLDTLGREYELTVLSDSPVRLRLEPTGAGLREFLSHLTVEFVPGAMSVRQVELHERDGDFTRITFSATVINGQLPEGTF